MDFIYILYENFNMKSFFTLISMLLIFSGNAQVTAAEKLPASVTVGKIAPMGAFVADLSYTVHGTDTTYTFSFNDKKYTQIDAIKSVSFTGGAGQFYTNIKTVFSDSNKKNKDYEIGFKLGKEDVLVKSFKSMGILQAMIYLKDGYTTLTEKQVDKLFGH